MKMDTPDSGKAHEGAGDDLDEQTNCIDPQVRTLVRTMNNLPGIDTFSSCGGHDEPSGASQLPAGEFYVAFSVRANRGGMRSLALLTWAVQVALWEKDLLGVKPDAARIITWSEDGLDCARPTSVLFQLEGASPVSPDQIARIVTYVERNKAAAIISRKKAGH